MDINTERFSKEGGIVSVESWQELKIILKYAYIYKVALNLNISCFFIFPLVCLVGEVKDSVHLFE